MAFLNTVFHWKEPGLLEKVLIPWLGKGKYKMRLQYLVRPRSEKEPKEPRENVKKTQEPAPSRCIWDKWHIEKANNKGLERKKDQGGVENQLISEGKMMRSEKSPVGNRGNHRLRQESSTDPGVIVHVHCLRASLHKTLTNYQGTNHQVPSHAETTSTRWQAQEHQWRAEWHPLPKAKPWGCNISGRCPAKAEHLHRTMRNIRQTQTEGHSEKQLPWMYQKGLCHEIQLRHFLRKTHSKWIFFFPEGFHWGDWWNLHKVWRLENSSNLMLSFWLSCIVVVRILWFQDNM